MIKSEDPATKKGIQTVFFSAKYWKRADFV